MSNRFRLYPDPGHVEALTRLCGDARAVWNLGVEQFEFAARYRPYRVGKRGSWPNEVTRGRDLSEARRVKGWIRDGSSMVQQQALRDLAKAFQNWWDRPDHFRRPTFRKAGANEGFNVTDVQPRVMNRKDKTTGTVRQVTRAGKLFKINNKWATINLPDIGPVRFRLTRTFGSIEASRSARITLDRSGRWHVSFAGPPAPIRRTPTGRAVGVDRGVANTIAFSTGELGHAPGLSEGEQTEFLRRKVALSNAPRGSAERDIHKRAVAKTYARLADRRKDWVEKSTTALVVEFDVIVVEKLHIVNMVRSAKGTIEDPGVNVRAKSGLNRAILAQCWGLWLQRLKQKAALCGVEVIEVPARNTSRRCHSCGHTAKGNRESQARFRCQNCGHEDHADINAAKNILTRGLPVGWTSPEPLGDAA